MTRNEKKNAMEQERQYLENLLKLKQEHPELRIVPWVDYEIVAGDINMYWIGSWGDSKIQKILQVGERYYEYDDKDMENVLIHFKGWGWYENAPEQELKAAYDALPWVEAIAVYIELPI